MPPTCSYTDAGVVSSLIGCSLLRRCAPMTASSLRSSEPSQLCPRFARSAGHRTVVSMAPRTDEGILNPAIAAYIGEHAAQPDDIQQRLIAATAERTGGASRMQIGSDQ